jgi:hypothetical protein
MQKNIFANLLPAAIDLPFVTITFMAEPVASDVRSLGDVPDMMLNFVDMASSVVYPFYLKVDRKVVDLDTLNTERASYLLQDAILTSIKDFGRRENNRVDEFNFEEAYSYFHYTTNAEGRRVLAHNANDLFFSTVTNIALPGPMHRQEGESVYCLDVRSTKATLTVSLTDTLIFKISISNPKDSVYPNDAHHITGTGRLFGAMSNVYVGTRYLGGDHAMPINRWFKRDVLHDIVIKKVQHALNNTFGPLTTAVFDEMIDGLEFHLPE